MTKTQPRVGPGLTRIEPPIWPFNPGQAPGVRLTLFSQATGPVQSTKHSKTGPNKPWPDWAANQTHHMYAERPLGCCGCGSMYAGRAVRWPLGLTTHSNDELANSAKSQRQADAGGTAHVGVVMGVGATMVICHVEHRGAGATTVICHPLLTHIRYEVSYWHATSINMIFLYHFYLFPDKIVFVKVISRQSL